MKYLKSFNKQSDYQSFIESDDFVTPNVTYVVEKSKVYYHPIEKKEEPKIIATYNCTNDNLVAFNVGGGNIRSLKIDGTVMEFEPPMVVNKVVEVYGTDMTDIDVANKTANFPEEWCLSMSPTSYVFRPMDGRNLDEIEYVCMFATMSGMKIFEPAPISQLIGMLELDYENNAVVVSDMFLAQISAGFENGLAYGFAFCDVNLETSEINVIDTIQEYSSVSGGLTTPFTFETPGVHNLEIELLTGRLNDSMFANTNLTSVEMNNKIVTISNSVFTSCSSLTSVTIGSGVTEIRNNAFKDCSGLTSINIPDSVTSIGEYAFYNCSGLTSVTIGSGVTSIGIFAFSDCSGLTEVTIGSGVTSIGSQAFYQCKGLTSINIPDSVTSIGDSAFKACSGLTSINIPDSVTSIGNEAFRYCSELTSVTIGSGVTSIGSSAFYYCSSLSSITCHAPTAPTISNDTFQYINSSGTLYVSAGSDYSSWMNTSSYYLGYYNWFIQELGVELPELTLDGYDVAVLMQPLTTTANTQIFGSSSSLSSVTEISVDATVLASPVTGYTFSTACDWHIVRYKFNNHEIPSSAFTSCDRIKEISINESVTSIGDYAFRGCSSLTGELVIPDSVTKIGDYAFENCKGLTGELVIPESVTSIKDRVFYNCSGLTSVTIGSGVTSIGSYAFFGCTSLPVENNLRYADTFLVGAVDKTQSMYTIKEGTKWIGSEAFSGSGLASINIPDSVTSIGNQAFEGCSGLTEVTIGSGVTSIGYGAFSGCTGLTSIVIPHSVTSIGTYAFSYCSGLTGGLVIPDSVTSIGNQAFKGCSGLTEVTIGSGVTSINGGAFDGCSSLTEIIIPDSVTSIDSAAFINCSSLTSIVVSSGNTVYDSRENCNCIIETATNKLIAGCNNSFIPDSVTSIGESAFNHCEGLTSVTIGSGVTSIGIFAFQYCSSLSSITCHAPTAPTISSKTFYGVKSNGILYYPAGSDYSSWLKTSLYNLGYYKWTGQEIS